MTQMQQPRRRTNLRGQQAQEQILEAAITLFAERGYNGTSLSELAAEAGVSKPSLLYHYPDKDALWVAAVEYLWAKVDAFFEERWPRSIPPSRRLIEEMLLLFVEAGTTWPAYIRIPFVEGATPSWRSEWLVDRHFGQHVRVTDRVLRAMQKRGMLPAGEVPMIQALLTSAINTTIAQAAMWERAFGKKYATKAKLTALVKLTLDCLLGPEVDQSVK